MPASYPYQGASKSSFVVGGALAKVILFTGQAGVNIGGALGKLAERVRASGSTCQVLKVEPQMIQRHLELHPGDPNNGLIRSDSGMQYLLVYPKDYLRGLWKMALEATLLVADAGVEYVFLAFHAISYHTKSREFFSTTDHLHLLRVMEGRKLRIEKIITLIDDVYDVIRRLRAPGHVFDLGPIFRARRTLAYWLSTHLELMRLFDWRAEEILASEELARHIDSPHYVLATKHPVDVAFALVATDKIPVYLSHPISEIRRMQREGLHEFATRVIDEIQALSERLIASDCVVPFLPTTIDELIIRRHAGGLIPEVEDRWPYRSDRALHMPPPNEAPVNPLDPLDVWPDLRTDPGAVATIGGSLEVMTDWVLAQISSRDRKLVEQSKVLVAYRPYYNGVQSRGVTAEIDHRNSLVHFGGAAEGERRVITLSLPEDLVRFRVNRLVEEVARQGSTAGGERLGPEILAQVKDALMEHTGILNAFREGRANAEAVEELLEDRFGIVFREIQNRYGALAGERQPMWRVETRQKWEDVAKGVILLDPMRDMKQVGDSYEERQASIEEFVAFVEERVCQGGKRP